MEFGTYIVLGVLMAMFAFALCVVLMAMRLLRGIYIQPVVQAEPTPPPTPQSGIMCYVCMERQATAMLLDCGHAGLCLPCAKRLLASTRTCPLCRNPISRVMQVDIVELA